MAARFQRWIMLGGLAVVLGLLELASWIGHLSWGAVAVVVFLSIYPATLAIELTMASVIGRRSFRQSMVPVAAARQLTRAWLGEIVAGIRVFCWEQPFRCTAEPNHLPDSSHGRRGVILVHGLFCNRGFWNRWLQRLRHDHDIPCIALNQEPLFCSIDEYVEALDAAIDRMVQVTGLAPVIVAHSMGGLVARRWLSLQPTGIGIHRVVTIGTPHSGTWLARFANTTNGRQMAVDSRWLENLRHIERAEDACLFTCFYGNCDNVVFPPENATLPGADNRLLTSVAHVQLAFRREVMQEVLRRVQ